MPNKGTADRSGLHNRGDRVADRSNKAGDRRDKVGDKVGDKAGDRRDKVGDRRENVADRKERVSKRHDNLHNRGDHIRDHMNRYHPRFNHWANHPNWARWRYNRPYRWATWGVLTGWFGWGGGGDTYVEYNYDYGGEVYCDDGYVYDGEDQMATTEEYAEQASDIAESGAAPVIQDGKVDSDDWMSLGVFALVHEEKGDPIMFLQLAVAKDGTIGGTYYNSQTEESKNIQGSVDKKTQRAAWTIAGEQLPVIETGIYNLTKDEASAMIHFKDGKTQTWLLVRMDEPKTDTDSAPSK